MMIKIKKPGLFKEYTEGPGDGDFVKQRSIFEGHLQEYS